MNPNVLKLIKIQVKMIIIMTYFPKNLIKQQNLIIKIFLIKIIRLEFQFIINLMKIHHFLNFTKIIKKKSSMIFQKFNQT